MSKKYTSWKDKYNEKYGYKKNESHSIEQISKDTGFSLKGLQQIYNKGIGAYKTNPSSVRQNVKSKEQWAMARIYSAVMGGKTSRIDAKELKMELGGNVGRGVVGESVTFYERTYADGTKQRFSVEEYEKNIYPLREKELKMAEGGNIGSLDNVIKELQQAILDYTLNKKAPERDNLFKSVENGFEYINMSNAFKEQDISSYEIKVKEVLFPLVIEGNSLLPNTKKYMINEFESYTDFIKNLPQSYISYLPKKDIENIKVKQVWDGKSLISPQQKVFWDIFKDWIGEDDLRPQMSGVFIDEYGATATNMHILLHLAGDNVKGNTTNDTIYAPNGSVIDLKYPNYRSVSDINKSIVLTSIDCSIMLNAMETIVSNRIVNQSTNQIIIKKDDKIIGVNAVFMADNFRTWLKIGVPKVDFYINNNDYEYNKRGLLFTEKGVSSYYQDKINYSLLMPVFLRTEEHDTYIEIIDENNIDLVVKGSPPYRFSSSQANTSTNDIKLLINDLKEAMKYMSGVEKKNTKKLIDDLEEAEMWYAEGGIITQFEIEAMKRYIESPQSNEFLVNSYKKVLAKFGVDISNLNLEKYPKGKYIDPYNFSGYEYMKQRNLEMGVSFLLTGEYELVSKAIFEKDYSMWLFYNYLGRINISFDACKQWLQQAQDYFEYTMPIPIFLVHTPKAQDGRSYAMWFGVGEIGKAEQEARIGRPIKFSYNGTYYYNEIGMVGNFDFNNDGWGTLYKEQKTGLLIPEYTQTSFHFNTLIHEFAHCLDFQSQLISNIEKYEDKELAKSSGDVVINTSELTELEKELYGNSLAEKPDTYARPITNHFDFFVDSLIKVLRASASGNIPLTQLYEQQALDVQTALSGVYGDLLLEQRERKRKEAEQIKRDDEVRENTRFTWQSNFVEDIRDYATQKAKQSSLKEKISKSNKSKPFTLTEIIEFDNLINSYVEDVFKGYMIKHPSKAPSLLEAIKKMKFETNRIINNHYDNIRNKFVYGFKPSNELEVYLLNNCDVKDFKDYKSWKECAKTKLQSKS